MLEVLTWIIAIPAFIGVMLNTYKKRVCFYFLLGANIALCLINCVAGTYAQAVLWAMYCFAAIWGLIQWKEPETKTKEVPFAKKETRRLPGHSRQRTKR